MTPVQEEREAPGTRADSGPMCLMKTPNAWCFRYSHGPLSAPQPMLSTQKEVRFSGRSFCLSLCCNSSFVGAWDPTLDFCPHAHLSMYTHDFLFLFKSAWIRTLAQVRLPCWFWTLGIVLHRFVFIKFNKFTSVKQVSFSDSWIYSWDI